MKFFATIAQAFIEMRQRQADRILGTHFDLLRHDGRMAAGIAADMATDLATDRNVVELAAPRATDSIVPAQLKLAA